MRKVLLGVAAVSMVVAACSRQPEEVTGEPPAEVQINAVHRVDRDAGTAALNVSALNEAGEPIEGHIDRVTATVDGVEPPTTGLASQNSLAVSASVCEQIVLHGAIHGVMSLDGSGSMSWNDPDEDRNAAAKQFVSRLGPTAQLAVASFPSSTFGEDYTLHQDFTSDKALLEAAIDEATFASGGTPLWNSSVSLVNEHLDGAENNKVLLVLTDGEDSTYNGPDDLIAAADHHNARVYFVGLGAPADLDETSMDRVAEATGGIYGRAAVSTELAGVFDGMLQAATASGEICLTFSPNPVPEGTTVSGTVSITIGSRDYAAPYTITF